MPHPRFSATTLVAPLSCAVFALSVLAAAGHGPSSKNSQIKAGAALFQKNCMMCHGANAKGGKFAPKLAGIKASNAKIIKTVTNGKPPKMPKFGSRLKTAEIKSIIAYLKSLK